MTLYFSNLIENIEPHTESNFLYLFLTKPQINDEDFGYIKFGKTENQTLIQRLKQYICKNNVEKSIIPTNIYYIKTTKINEKEMLLKRMFEFHKDIELYNGKEYFKGPLKLMINIFAYITLAKDDQLNNITYKYNGEGKQIFEIINEFNYEIIKVKYIIEKNENLKEINDFLSCSKCNKICKNKGGLTKHENVCQEENRKICPYCKYEFNTVQNCKRHLEDNNCLEYKKILEKQKDDKIKELENEIIEKDNKLKTKVTNYTQTIKKLETDIRNYQLSSNDDKLELLKIIYKHIDEVNDQL